MFHMVKYLSQLFIRFQQIQPARFVTKALGKVNDFVSFFFLYSYQFGFLVAGTFYNDPQFIRTKIDPISDNLLKVTWYALYHSSLFKRCIF